MTKRWDDDNNNSSSSSINNRNNTIIIINNDLPYRILKMLSSSFFLIKYFLFFFASFFFFFSKNCYCFWHVFIRKTISLRKSHLHSHKLAPIHECPYIVYVTARVFTQNLKTSRQINTHTNNPISHYYSLIFSFFLPSFWVNRRSNEMIWNAPLCWRIKISIRRQRKNQSKLK